MRLLRLAIIHLDKVPDEWSKCVLTRGPTKVSIHSSSKKDGKTRLLMIAETGLKYLPKITSQQKVVVPEKERILLEKAIDDLSNLLSVVTQLPKEITSPIPFVVLIPETAQDKQLLKKAKGIHYPPKKWDCGIDGSFGAPDHLFTTLSDRFDGVQLMAEAVSQPHSSGRYHEFIRLFERAFRSSSKQLVPLLVNFLETSQFGYTPLEIEKWILTVRHNLTHADEKELFLTEADVRPFINRVEQAANDVLFNKVNWRSSDSARRATWVPLIGTESSNGDVFTNIGIETKLKFTLYDHFNIYKHTGDEVLKTILPHWWCPPEPCAVESSFQFTVRPLHNEKSAE